MRPKIIVAALALVACATTVGLMIANTSKASTDAIPAQDQYGQGAQISNERVDNGAKALGTQAQMNTGTAAVKPDEISVDNGRSLPSTNLTASVAQNASMKPDQTISVIANANGTNENTGNTATGATLQREKQAQVNTSHAQRNPDFDPSMPAASDDQTSRLAVSAKKN